MTPRTRKSNRDASYKVYYSKKVPQQVRFPHRKKTVRRPEPAGQDAGENRQMRFLPEQMMHHKIQDEDASDEGEAGEEATEETMWSTPVNQGTGKRRRGGDFQREPGSNGEFMPPSSKRQRRTKLPTEEPSRTLRRQSTMTQLADGHRPSICGDEPDSQPPKRRTRVSRGGLGATEGERAKKQRTLTQMIPGMGRLSKEKLEELSDLDAGVEDDEADKNAVSQALIEQGLLEVDAPAHVTASVQRDDDVEDDTVQVREAKGRGLPAVLLMQSSATVKSVEGHDDQEYHPTQFIQAPTFRTRQTPRRTAALACSDKLAEPERSVKSRFSLLSTPEKRRVYEIPSSQSPTESVLSIQISTQKSHRSALKERAINTNPVTETPSKRGRVAFQELSAQPQPPARLRKFESTIQDSEDEDESDLEIVALEHDLVDIEDRVMHGHGAETRAMLKRADLTCKNENGDKLWDSQDSSEEIEDHTVRQKPYQPSPELGESWAPVMYDDDGPEYESYQSSQPNAKMQSLRVAGASKESLPVLDQVNVVSQLDLTTQAPEPAENIPSTPPMISPQPDEDLPSTPMDIRDNYSDDEDIRSERSPPHAVRHVLPEPPSTLIHQSTDLDGEPVQVPRSPSMDLETQQSHSSKAEQQLQNEWLSYSQYVYNREPNSSSMHPAVDTFSYNATPRAPRTDALIPSSARMQYSQATTVDEVTPKKNRTQRVISANTTPHRFSKSQPYISPEKPPSLFIPSSFPSPSRAAMEGWSSPVAARTQNVYGSSQVVDSLEDFSIPLPPPIEDD